MANKTLLQKSLTLLLCVLMLLAILPTAFAETDTAALTDNLVLRYTFDSAENNVIKDISGNNKDATIEGSVTVANGVATLSGGAIKLPDDLLNDLDAVTVTTWVKRNRVTQDSRLFDIGNDQQNYFQFSPNSAWSQIISEVNIRNTLVAAVNKEKASAAFLNQSGFPEVGKWAFVAVAWGGGSLKIYVDGDLLGSTELTDKPSDLANMKDSWIGKSKYPADVPLEADIKDFRVYSTALSADSVKQLADNEPNVQPETIPNGHLLVSYDFSALEADEKTILDKSGNGRNATINGAVTVDRIANLTGGYIKLPDNLLNDLDAVSISAWINRDAIQADARLFDIGNDTSNYFQFAPNTAWSQIISEVNIGGTLQMAVNKPKAPTTGLGQSGFPDCGTWAFVTVVWGDGSLKIYVDGNLLGSTELSGKPSDLANLTNSYIGKSQYHDPNLLAKLDNFQIHNIALTKGQILTLMQEPNNNDEVDLIIALNELDIATDIYEDLVLPSSSSDGKVQFTWKSSSTADLTDDGKLVDGHESGAQTVTLTVTASQEAEMGETKTLTKQFTLNVHYLTNADKVAEAKNNLGLVTLVDADSLYLPATADHGVTITWETSDASVIEANGTVHRAEVGGGSKTCTLTATLRCGDATDTKVFPDRLVMEKYAGYLLTYFGGDELATDTEYLYSKVHFAFSMDGLHWTPLKGNETIVEATIKGRENPDLYGDSCADYSLARDPMVYRQQDGKLRLMSSHSWNNPSIYVWDAGDLCSFSGERILRVNMIKNGNAWAPECTYDPIKGKYMIIYTDPDGRTSGGSCGWGTYTTDFTQDDLLNEECNIPLMCVDEVVFYPYIDCSMYTDITTGKYYMTYARCDTNAVQGIYIAEATRLGRDVFNPINNNDYISPYECEGPFMIKALNEDRYYVYYDHFTRGGKFGCSTTTHPSSNSWRIMDESEFSMPAGVRHGNAIPITQGELDKLIATYGISVTDVETPTPVLSTYESYADALPETVTVILEDGSKKEVAVTWDTSKVTDEQKSFTLYGTLAATDGVYEENLYKATMTLTLHEHEWSTTWSRDEQYHWRTCQTVGCTATDQKTAHTPDREAPTENDPVKCETCGYVLNPELGHQHKNHLTSVAEVAATCRSTGSIAHYRCSCNKLFADGNAETELTAEQIVTAIDPNNHVGGTELHNVQAPTYTEEGYTGDTCCLGCGATLAAGQTIPKLTPPATPVKPSTPAKLPFNPNAGSGADKLPFTDVSSNSWYYSSVRSAWEKGLIDGVTASEFRPDATLTVAQAIKLAAALHQLDKTGTVSLKNGGTSWYESYLSYAIANGIIEKDYASYTAAQLNAPVTRGEFVHIFHGAEEAYKAINTVADGAIPDVKATDRFAAEIYEFYRAGILTGSDAKGTFHVDSTIKRSEAAAILLRMFESTERKSIILN